MKVVAFNSSPNMEKGNTAFMLNQFLDGMRGAGADVELFYVKKLDIKPCIGCFNCWLKTPGVCVHKDDMRNILPKLSKADVKVIATPLYVDGMTGTMKVLIDRTIPLATPYIVLKDGHCRHDSREGVMAGKVVLISACGFWERDNFNPLVEHIKAFCRNDKSEFAGALLRPHAAVLRTMSELGAPVDDVLGAAHEAGKALVMTGKIPEQLIQTISRELLPRDVYLEMANKHFKGVLEANSVL